MQLKWLRYDRKVLWLLFLINLAGTIYGFIWYKYQLQDTPPIFMAFVPDSPTASLFFTLFLLFYIFRRQAPYIEALALVTLVKYGIWAVVMNLLTRIQDGYLSPQGYMLMLSHGAMAIEGILFASLYVFKLKHLVIAAVWALHNDIIDYVFGMMPVYASLTKYMNQIGYFTFWLSIFSIYLAYFLVVRKKQTGLQV